MEDIALSIFSPDGALLTLMDGDGNVLVTIERDRSLTFTEHYDPDEAARTFWEHMARYAPVFLPEREPVLDHVRKP